jgi:DNA-binding NtrC family response regulator
LLQRAKSEAEKDAIATAPEKTSWNQSAPAHVLKVSYRSLLSKIEQYGLTTFRGVSRGEANKLSNMGHTEWAPAGK